MIRIISGVLKHTKLSTLKGQHTRPTSDRIREAIFNILGHRVKDTIVLDLFAGTGAFSMEALSRGARSALLIDNDHGVLRLIRRNIRNCHLDNHTQVIQWDIVKNLNCIRSHTPPFNLVFMDPPYDQGMIKPTLVNLSNTGALSNTAIVIIEHAEGEKIPGTDSPFQIVDRRRYGKTIVSFLTFMI